MTPVIKIDRIEQDENQTIGICVVYIGDKVKLISTSLERGWKNNEQNISCVPIGYYDVVLEYSPRFKMDLWEIKGVNGRSECKFHSANYWKQLNGCIALGNYLLDINSDGYMDVLNSKDTMKSFHNVLKGYTKAKLIITDNF